MFEVGDILFTAPETKATDASGASKGVKPLRYDLIPVEAMAEVAYQYHVGALKHGENNFVAGMPFSWNIAAMQRHLEKFKLGQDWDEEADGERKTHHLAAVVFHALALMTYEARNVGTDDRQKETK